jgi:hypothetical protein
VTFEWSQKKVEKDKRIKRHASAWFKRAELRFRKGAKLLQPAASCPA